MVSVERPEEDGAEYQNQNAAQNRREEAGGSQLLRPFLLMMSQLPGHVVSRALAKEKSTGLYDSHERKGNPHSAGGTGGVQLPDEEGVSHIVNGGD